MKMLMFILNIIIISIIFFSYFSIIIDEEMSVQRNKNMNDINGAKVATANQNCHIATIMCKEFQRPFIEHQVVRQFSVYLTHKLSLYLNKLSSSPT